MILKRGTPEWWTAIALTHTKVSKVGESITINVEGINHWIESINRNPLKKLWVLLTNGDIRQRDTTEAERILLYKKMYGEKGQSK